MKTRQVLFLIFFFTMTLLTSSFVWAVPRPDSAGPVITRAFGPEVGKYGDPLRFYIEADDPTADMLRIAVVVDQAGYGHYPTDWVYVSKNDRGHFVGYVQWNTFSSNASRLPEWTQLTVKISVFDAKGHESNSVVFPLEFVTTGVPKTQPPPPFDSPSVQKLGHVDINLYNPDELGGNEMHG